MKIAAVSLIQNECDILELFFRLNAGFVDHFYVVDNGSSDPSLEIIEQLRTEGMPITLWSYPSLDYQQDIITTGAIQEALTDYNWDWITVLDADEILIGSREELTAELARLAPDVCGALNWRTYVPDNGGYAEVENPLYTLFKPRTSEHRQFSKVVLPRSVGQSGAVSMGSHVAFDSSRRPVSQTTLSTFMAHVPVRSSAQIVSKALIGSHKLSLKANRGKLECFHWDVIAGMARENGYELQDADLRRIALSYALMPDDPVAETVDDAPRIGTSGDRIVYKDLSRVSLGHRLDHFAATLCHSLASAR